MNTIYWLGRYFLKPAVACGSLICGQLSVINFYFILVCQVEQMIDRKEVGKKNGARRTIEHAHITDKETGGHPDDYI